MTLTYPIINRCRHILWLVIGSEKADMLVRLAEGDSMIPAGRVRRDHALVLDLFPGQLGEEGGHLRVERHGDRAPCPQATRPARIPRRDVN